MTALQLFFHFADAGLGGVAFRFGLDPVGSFVLEPGDVQPGFGVDPEQFAPLPAQVEVEGGAVPLVSVAVDLLDGDGLIGPVDQPFPGKRNKVVVAAGVVEAPVFGDAEGGVAGPALA